MCKWISVFKRKPKVTICTDCIQHFFGTSGAHHCEKNPINDKLDYVTGVVIDGYHICSDINSDGKCPDFHERRNV